MQRTLLEQGSRQSARLIRKTRNEITPPVAYSLQDLYCTTNALHFLRDAGIGPMPNPQRNPVVSIETKGQFDRRQDSIQPGGPGFFCRGVLPLAKVSRYLKALEARPIPTLQTLSPTRGARN